MIDMRVYSVSFSASAQTAAVDWFELTAPSGGGLVLLGLDISQSTDYKDAEEEGVRWFVRRAGGSFTSGSGGNTGVARPPVRSTDASATFTAETLNTTQAVAGSGTLTTLHQSVFNIRTGLLMWWTPETALGCKAAEAIVVGMGAAPGDSVSWEGTAYVGEILG